MKYVFQERRSEFREITYNANSFEEAYWKWKNGEAPDSTTKWDDAGDDEIDLVVIIESDGEVIGE